MTYDIFKRTAPTMPTPGKGTKIVGFLLSKASKDMQEALLPMIMPALSAHLTDVEFLYSDGKYYPMCGQVGHLVGPSGIGKGQLTQLVEAVMRVNLTMSSTPDAAHNTQNKTRSCSTQRKNSPSCTSPTAVRRRRSSTSGDGYSIAPNCTASCRPPATGRPATTSPHDRQNSSSTTSAVRKKVPKCATM